MKKNHWRPYLDMYLPRQKTAPPPKKEATGSMKNNSIGTFSIKAQLIIIPTSLTNFPMIGKTIKRLQPYLSANAPAKKENIHAGPESYD